MCLILVRRAWSLVFVCALECSCGVGNSSPKSPQLSIPIASLPSGMVSITYNQTVASEGGTAPFTWTVSSGSLPHNVTLANNSTDSVVLTGTPDTVGEATFTLQVKDSQGKSACQPYSITIAVTGSATLQATNEQTPTGIVEIRGLSAGPFNPVPWQQNHLNWVPDVRAPLLAPLPGGWQNIYSPWPLEETNGWLLFFGGWGGSDTPNDRVYDVLTPDFLSLGNRALVIDHGQFQHVNNVNVRQLPDGSLHMICTVLKDGNSLDKPAYFSSPDGTTWNGVPEPYSAQLSDVVSISNDPNYVAGISMAATFCCGITTSGRFTTVLEFMAPSGSPDRQWFQISGPLTGTITVYAEDGVTPLAKDTISVNGGTSYQLVLGN
jgi:hypothetical protein